MQLETVRTGIGLRALMLAAAKVTVALTRIELGNLSNVKGVGAGVQELRIDFGPGYRVYFGRDGDRLVILLAGGTKSRQQKDISTAQKRWADHKKRKKDEKATRAGDGSRQRMRREPMALTRDFKETVKARAERNAAFREALLTEAVERLIAGEVEVGKAVLRDYINATVGFEKLAKATGTPSKSLMRMFGPKGNPRANNLFAVIGKLQRVSGIRLAVASGGRKRAA